MRAKQRKREQAETQSFRKRIMWKAVWAEEKQSKGETEKKMEQE